MSTAKKSAKKGAPAEVVTAYKGFDSNLVCDPTGSKPFQYAIGETYHHDGEVVRCASGGFHACENPIEVFGYYAPAGSRYCLVEASGAVDRDSDDTKIACGSITIKAELKLPELIIRAIDWVTARIDKSIEQTLVGNTASNTGDYSAASVAGAHSVAISSGVRGKAKASAGSAIVLCYRNDDGELLHIRAAIAGQDGVKPDAWYSLDAAGEFVEVAA